ncbi:LOW QUALITY PROTEIN: hypothetical protein BSKO_09100 [Bryopsis sp. KO-2023]|nr:LOW QUALITY PROTEIN: hypothetical protein BSKO_09100 [Bryopsis sp. KO-2023]
MAAQCLTVMEAGTSRLIGVQTHGLYLVDLAGSKEVKRQTRLLQDSLSGQAKSMMFMRVAPEMSSRGETLSTAMFGVRVSQISLGEGDCLKEANHITKSLSTLTACLSEITTQLLQHSLSGQAKSMMFMHVGPEMSSRGETLSTAIFGARMPQITLGRTIHDRRTKDGGRPEALEGWSSSLHITPTSNSFCFLLFKQQGPHHQSHHSRAWSFLSSAPAVMSGFGFDVLRELRKGIPTEFFAGDLLPCPTRKSTTAFYMWRTVMLRETNKRKTGALITIALEVAMPGGSSDADIKWNPPATPTRSKEQAQSERIIAITVYGKIILAGFGVKEMLFLDSMGHVSCPIEQLASLTLFMTASTHQWQVDFQINVQMLEITMGSLCDLLGDDENKNNNLAIQPIEKSNLNVRDAVQKSVECAEDVLEVMDIKYNDRAVGSTEMNDRSSRMHNVLTGVDASTNRLIGVQTHGCLHLVDLPGSKCISRSQATGDCLKEANHINKSLSALAALASKSNHVPFRNCNSIDVHARWPRNVDQRGTTQCSHVRSQSVTDQPRTGPEECQKVPTTKAIIPGPDPGPTPTRAPVGSTSAALSLMS